MIWLTLRTQKKILLYKNWTCWWVKESKRIDSTALVVKCNVPSSPHPRPILAWWVIICTIFISPEKTVNRFKLWERKCCSLCGTELAIISFMINWTKVKTLVMQLYVTFWNHTTMVKLFQQTLFTIVITRISNLAYLPFAWPLMKDVISLIGIKHYVFHCNLQGFKEANFCTWKIRTEQPTFDHSFLEIWMNFPLILYNLSTSS